MGVARVAPLEREADALRRWIAKGHHASMQWMADTVEVRIDPTHAGMLEGARSVLVLATSYARPDGPEGACASAPKTGGALAPSASGGGAAFQERRGPSPGVVARYARGRDYHNLIGKRARKLAEMLRDEGHAARVSVDAVPVLERAWAQQAGVGFIGKNCCLIIPGLGSHVLLATVVTSAELPADAPMQERCGSCRLCLDACPTRAFVDTRELDARRCISYLSIEHRGPIDEELREGMGLHLFGCDDCQDVCPFNRTAPPPPETTTPFAPDPRLDIEAAELLAMDDARFEAWAIGSPLKRPKREGMARNAAIVLGNTRERRHLPVLHEAASSHDSEVVRDAARWAIERIERG